MKFSKDTINKAYEEAAEDYRIEPFLSKIEVKHIKTLYPESDFYYKKSLLEDIGSHGCAAFSVDGIRIWDNESEDSEFKFVRAIVYLHDILVRIQCSENSNKSKSSILAKIAKW